MKRRGIRSAILSCASLLSVIIGAFTPSSFPAFAQESSATRPGAIVKAQAYVSREPVPQGSTFEVAVVAEIPAAYHMNAHKTSDQYLIPTTVAVDLPRGIDQMEISYPPGKLKKFGFSATPLNVYEGRAVFRIKLSASAQASVGSLELPLTLRYQACNETTCFPPARAPVQAMLKIAPAGTASHPLHPEIFVKQ